MNLKEIVSNIITKLEELDRVRDELIKTSRDVIKLSKEVINNVLKGNIEKAHEYLSRLKEIVHLIISKARNYPELYFSGFLTGVLTEYVEATVLYEIVTKSRYPTPQELSVSEVPYLLGLGDVVGELRRLVLDSLRSSDYSRAEKYFKFMEEIYENLSTIVLPDAVVPGLRPKIDNARRLLEYARSDLFLAQLRFRLSLSVEDK